MSGKLDLLLADEIERRGSVFAAETPEPEEVRAAFHALRGSAAMAGHTELALALGNYGAQLRRGDVAVVAVAAEVLGGAVERLRAGRPALTTAWPTPPMGMTAAPVDPAFAAEYRAAMGDRLAQLDEAIEDGDDRERLEIAFRTVHSVKGAAAAVGDEATAWYCHGLEARLKEARDAGNTRVVDDLAKHRSVLALFLEDPAEALAKLSRGVSLPPSLRPSRAPPEAESVDAVLRIPAQTIETLLSRVEQVDQLRDALGLRADRTRATASTLRGERASLLEALRQIGPARPWGAPATALSRIEQAAHVLGDVADRAERSGTGLRRTADAVQWRAREMRTSLSSLQRSAVRELLERVARAAEGFATRESRLVRVVIDCEETPVDRVVAERLFDPLLQLAKNALAHGIESTADRATRGKPTVGTISLRAERVGDWLRISVADDGRGIDIDALKTLALERGALNPATLPSATDDELLSLLFLPGLTTQSRADVLAGRGIGLDLAESVAHRLGGSLRLSTRAGSGVTATLEVPIERSVVDVVWVDAAGRSFALPLRFSGRVLRVRQPVVSLAACLGLPPNAASPLGVELVLQGDERTVVGVDAVGAVEEVHLRPLPRLRSERVPFSAAVLRRDGALAFALDAQAVAARVWQAGQ